MLSAAGQSAGRLASRISQGRNARFAFSPGDVSLASSVGLAGRHTGPLPPEAVVFGQTPGMREIRARLDRVASANVSVLIEGESGTGKEVIASLIHARSPWTHGPFVKVNCPAIPATLMESELFGYERGAFTGAVGSKPGRVEMAHRGTLFLDEIGELELSLQAKLLQLLQDGQFCKIGAQEDRKVEVRVVCATNRDLEHEIAEGLFRQDLYYRINVVNLHLPPLRERRADLPQLIAYFIDSYNQAYGRRASLLSPELMQVLHRYHWPGNIRELANLMKRYVILGNEEVVTTELQARREPTFDFDIPPDGKVSLKALTRQATRDVERKVILRVLQVHNWNRRRAAKALSISYRALLYKMRDAEVTAASASFDGTGLAPPVATSYAGD
ncbi:MAG TPA: sigma 54-interacting transcriptional regulator [Terriglobales bacterium]|nr:sigma 54-interacting transcriptional regulator [Terriglobales bacterium]